MILIPQALVLHDDVIPPESFTKLGRAADDTPIQLQIHLVSRNLTGLEWVLADIAEPTRPGYGRWLSREQVQHHLAPTKEKTVLVSAWLAAYNITETDASSAGDWVLFNTTVQRANEMLAADYSVYVHAKIQSTGQYLRTPRYSLPAALKSTHIRLIHPTTSFVGPAISSLIPIRQLGGKQGHPCTSAAKSSTCRDSVNAPQGVVTPTCLQSPYNVTLGALPPLFAASGRPNRIAVTSFGNQYASQLRCVDVWTIGRGRHAAYGSPERNLDTQYVGALTGGTDTEVVFISAGRSNDALSGFLDLARALLGDDDTPDVISTSYGFDGENRIG
ncbi:Tripeptidyl-peptidase SED2 [Mycena kentingensis (nom. inval.)]|nr:Tripeptidyl-peptidase SED2 [Mycena kentingensis (nom. inval.)]